MFVYTCERDHDANLDRDLLFFFDRSTDGIFYSVNNNDVVFTCAQQCNKRLQGLQLDTDVKLLYGCRNIHDESDFSPIPILFLNSSI